MQQYPNYWINNYPQYQQQPMYQNQNVNPYMDQLSQLRSMQQMPVPQQNAYQGLNSRLVDDFNVITANDVPMDGNGAIFIKKDGSEIQHRNWTAQGTIATSVFKPVSSDTPSIPQGSQGKVEIGLSDDVTEVLKTYFEQINKRFDELEKSIIPLD